MIITPQSTSFSITAELVSPTDPTRSTSATVSHTLLDDQWRAYGAGAGSMGQISRPLDAARGAALVQRANAFVDSHEPMRGSRFGQSRLTIYTPETGNVDYAVDTLAGQQLLRDVFAATGPAQSHGRVVRHEVAR